MGLFSSSTIVVSSSVWNLAGDVDQRPQYLKTLVASATLGGQPSIADTVVDGYLHGPGIKLRSFARWADSSGYNAAIGLVSGSVSVGNSLNNTVVQTQIPHGAGELVNLLTAYIRRGEFVEWAEEYVSLYHPDQLGTTWAADYNESTNQITIFWAGGGSVSFTPAGYNPLAYYIYADYTLAYVDEVGPLEEGDPVTLDTGEPFPDVSEWAETSYVETLEPVTLITTIETHSTFSDSRPPEDDTTTEEVADDYIESHGVYERDVAEGFTGSQWIVNHQTQYQDQTAVIVAGSPVVTESDEDIGGGVIKHTVTTTTPQVIVLVRTTQIDEQRTYSRLGSLLRKFRYQQNTGNATLDAMFAVPSSGQEFFPFIPIRLDNQWASDTQPAAWALGKKAFKRLTTDGKLEKTKAQIADNAQLGDIDYAYVVCGVPLNVKEQACRRYLYEFWRTMMLSPETDLAAFDNYVSGFNTAYLSQAAYWAWLFPPEGTTRPETPPAIVPYPTLPDYVVNVSSDNNTVMNFDMEIHYVGMTEEIGTGIKDGAHAIGELWFEKGPVHTFEPAYVTTEMNDNGSLIWGLGLPIEVEVTYLHWQESATVWRTMTVYGLRHVNRVYQGRAVFITAHEALDDVEESGFLFPLHRGIFRAMPLVLSTQMSTACCYLVFNCYQIVKAKWYQTSFFRAILIIIVIAVTILSAGSAGPASAGLLGTNAAVGTALGFAGLTAVIVGAVANAIAAMLLVTLIQKGSTLLFGEKIGAIVGFIASIFAIQAGTAYMSGTSFTASLGSLVRAENLLKLTIGGANAMSQYMNAGLQETLQETQQITENYTATMGQLEQLTKQNLGNGLATFNPLELTEAGQSYVAEPPDSFLSRTLMTGSEIATMSIDMLTNLVDTTLNLNPAI